MRAHGHLARTKIVDRFVNARPHSGFTRKEIEARVTELCRYDKRARAWVLKRARRWDSQISSLESSAGYVVADDSSEDDAAPAPATASQDSSLFRRTIASQEDSAPAPDVWTW